MSANRILTKMLLDDQRANTLIFFGVSVLAVALCFILHQIVRRTDFVQFYLTLCRESRKITLEPTEDAGLVSFSLTIYCFCSFETIMLNLFNADTLTVIFIFYHLSPQ